MDFSGLGTNQNQNRTSASATSQQQRPGVRNFTPLELIEENRDSPVSGTTDRNLDLSADERRADHYRRYTQNLDRLSDSSGHANTNQPYLPGRRAREAKNCMLAANQEPAQQQNLANERLEVTKHSQGVGAENNLDQRNTLNLNNTQSNAPRSPTTYGDWRDVLLRPNRTSTTHADRQEEEEAQERQERRHSPVLNWSQETRYFQPPDIGVARATEASGQLPTDTVRYTRPPSMQGTGAVSQSIVPEQTGNPVMFPQSTPATEGLGATGPWFQYSGSRPALDGMPGMAEHQEQAGPWQMEQRSLHRQQNPFNLYRNPQGNRTNARSATSLTFPKPSFTQED
jgi:hypothetical protein